MTINKKYLMISIVLCLSLCVAQIVGSTILILACLGTFMLFIGWICSHDYTLPIMLFFLPWSPLLRLSPTSFSFYTFATVLVCLIGIVKNRFSFKNYHIKAGICILFLTLLSKLLDGGGLSFAYIAFLMMIVLFPTVKEEIHKHKYEFLQVVVFFSLGVAISSLCAMYLSNYGNIRKYIQVYEYLTIVRRCGFYGDPNFYTAQVLAAMSGAMILVMQQKKKGIMVFLVALILLLFYCGMLSGSKSFAIVSAILVLLWVVSILKMRGRAGVKLILLGVLVFAGVYAATSVLFSGLIQVIVTRFLASNDANSFTTGRLDLWMSYFEEIMGNVKVFFLGRGFTNVKVNGRASHNTLLQIIYQFGVIGAPMLLYWVICFWQDTLRGLEKRVTLDINLLMVLIGSFMPWLAIDLLFFDEFFLLQWYVLVAMGASQPIIKQQTMEKEKNGSYGGKVWT